MQQQQQHESSLVGVQGNSEDEFELRSEKLNRYIWCLRSFYETSRVEPYLITACEIN